MVLRDRRTRVCSQVWNKTSYLYNSTRQLKFVSGVKGKRKTEATAVLLEPKSRRTSLVRAFYNYMSTYKNTPLMLYFEVPSCSVRTPPPPPPEKTPPPNCSIIAYYLVQVFAGAQNSCSPWQELPITELESRGVSFPEEAFSSNITALLLVQ